MKGMKFQDLMDNARKEAMARIKAGQPVRKSPKAQVEGSEADLYLYDAIDSWWGIDAKEFIDELNSIEAETINLHINSPGGSVFDARAIQTALNKHSAKIVVHIDGLAASAATYIAVTQDEVNMSEGALFMIHNAWTIAWGNAEELIDTAALLEKIDTTIVTDYKNKSGQDEKQIREWMTAETWFSADESKEAGFIDNIFSPSSKETEEETEEEEAEAVNNCVESNSNKGLVMSALMREVELIEMGA